MTPETERHLSALVVEDSGILVERLREMLESVEGIDIIDVVDSEMAALMVIRSSPIDVVLLDLKLRQGDGFGVLHAVPVDSRRPVFVVLSNYSLSEYRDAAQQLGAAFFLDKLHEMESLPAVLCEIRQRRPAH